MTGPVTQTHTHQTFNLRNSCQYQLQTKIVKCEGRAVNMRARMKLQVAQNEYYLDIRRSEEHSRALV